MKIRGFWAKCIDLVPAIYIFLSGETPTSLRERGSITETKCNEHLQRIFHTASPPAANRQTPYIDHPKRYMNTS
jgi:hypothetical protein